MEQSGNNGEAQLTKTQQKEVQTKIGNWLTLLVRGAMLRHPLDIKGHGNNDTLYIRAKFAKDYDLPTPEQKEKFTEEDYEYQDLFFNNVPEMTFTPLATAHTADFKGEWPPESLIKEHNAKTPPGIIKPTADQVSKIIKGGKPN